MLRQRKPFCSWTQFESNILKIYPMASTSSSESSGLVSGGSTTTTSTTINASSIMAAIQEAVTTEVRVAVSRVLPAASSSSLSVSNASSGI